jgi:hypothetical protein
MVATLTRSEVFQATDVQRKSRAVLDAAHQPGGALIRDRDGEALHIGLAQEASLEHYLRRGFQNAAAIALACLAAHRGPSLTDPDFGDLAWVTVLPGDQQMLFVRDYVAALRKAPGLGTDQVDQLVYEWQQTARAWADEDLRDELRTDIPEPLYDVEL